jgi:putative salt-induced outer membrane protein
MDALWQDARYAVVMMRRDAGFTAAASRCGSTASPSRRRCSRCSARHPALGRFFRLDEGAEDRDAVAVLSDRGWRERLGGDVFDRGPERPAWYARCWASESMNDSRALFAFLLVLSATVPTFAQQPAAPPAPPPPLWDMQAGASFVGTTGNSDTESFGADFNAHRRGLVWQIESSAMAIRTVNNDATTAERYLGMLRGQRKLTPIIGLSSGAKLERDRFSGLEFRSIFDGGLSWALLSRPEWTLDGVTSVAWLHESRTVGADVDDPVGVFQVLSRILFGGAGDTTQRVTFYPDFKTSSAYRTEAEVTAQGAMNAHLVLKVGYVLRYSNDPVPGFKKTDNTTTVSVVLRWKSMTSAPAP